MFISHQNPPANPSSMLLSVRTSHCKKKLKFCLEVLRCDERNTRCGKEGAIIKTKIINSNIAFTYIKRLK
jgi:hypothetical protein